MNKKMFIAHFCSIAVLCSAAGISASRLETATAQLKQQFKHKILHPSQKVYNQVPNPIKKHLTTIITAAFVAFLASDWGREHVTAPVWNNTAVPAWNHTGVPVWNFTTEASRTTWNHTAVPAWNWTAVPAWRLARAIASTIDEYTLNELVPVREWREKRDQARTEAQVTAAQQQRRDQLAAADLDRQHQEEQQEALNAERTAEGQRIIDILGDTYVTREEFALRLQNFVTTDGVQEQLACYVTINELMQHGYQDETQVRNIARALLPAPQVQQ